MLLTFSSLPGQTIFIAQFNPALRGEFDLSHGQFGLIYTLATLGSSVLLAAIGGLTDRFPIHRLVPVALGGLALTGVAMANVPHVAVLVLILFGLRFFGQGLTSLIAMTSMARWFNRYRGRALALAQLGFPAGESALPILITLSIAAIGWRQSWLLAAVILIAVMLPLVLLLWRHAPDGRRAKKSGATNPDGREQAKTTGARWTRGQVMRDPLFLLAIPGFLGPPAIGTLFIFHQAHLSTVKGWDPAVFAAFFPVLSGFSVLFAVVSGILIDRRGAWRIVPLILIPEGLGCLVIGSFDSFWTIPLFFALFGATNGMSSPVVGALWTELYGNAHIGAVRALATSMFVFASAVGPGIAGMLIDGGVELGPQAFAYAAFCFVSAGGYFLLRGRFRQRAEEIATEIAAEITAEG